jgi:hypothetical protein
MLRNFNEQRNRLLLGPFMRISAVGIPIKNILKMPIIFAYKCTLDQRNGAAKSQWIDFLFKSNTISFLHR